MIPVEIGRRAPGGTASLTVEPILLETLLTAATVAKRGRSFDLALNVASGREGGARTGTDCFVIDWIGFEGFRRNIGSSSSSIAESVNQAHFT